MKVALITGSSRGIGAAIATELVVEGWSVIIHYTNNEQSATDLATKLGNACIGIVRADLRDPIQTRELWKQSTEMAKVSALVNNAGIYIQSPFSIPEKQWHEIRSEQFRVNFEAPCELIHYAMPYFKSQGGGKILNVASRVGFRGEAGASMYAASKAALINLTRSLAVEYANTGIELFGIAPGWVETAMARDGMEDRLEEIIKTIPMGRMAHPKDCAVTAAFLLSDKAAYLSGSVLDINGASYFH
jgi:3-oxoacyl-[acyl-carrier protein] reductase